MKIILRDLLTGLYYGGNQTWSAGVAGAMEFDSIQRATAMAHEQKLETVNVVLRYEEPTCELTLPLGPRVFPVAGVGIKGQDLRPPGRTCGDAPLNGLGT